MTSLQMGETMPNIAKDMDTYSYTLPLGKHDDDDETRCQLDVNFEPLCVAILSSLQRRKTETLIPFTANLNAAKVTTRL